ncbi:ATP-NAD kinase family protein [Marinobacterium lutimaris]|uniref:Predicted polyphosphate-or ATP-dependent NAD kinase n=1 Tax=Marinobacterium lutimaris TaxID=568106 RepID=A0A1H5U381_9GAMM|nr:ATP-NAD kinase family protein [Marinobacterium lutimaris]SEF69513.1 Predicted polyphosphate-or ATP-dependent NAD kinase [Marinobacterium lutimaris]
MTFTLGLVVNPLAGLGGSVGLKGSDGAETVAKALALGAEAKAPERAMTALQELVGLDFRLITWAGSMGEDSALAAGFSPEVMGVAAQQPSTAADTEAAAVTLAEQGADLILFAGGDGTARNICAAVAERCPVLGIPAGVKIHSGVYAITPKAAGEVAAMLIRGELVTLSSGEVRDIDEEAFRAGKVRARYYGELLVPSEHRYLQHVKNGQREDESLVLDDIAADFEESMQPGVRYIMGSGSTVAAIMEHLGLDNTLLGVDLIQDGELIASDCTAKQLLELTEGVETRVVITPIGGQGHLLGRGNQQLSPELMRRVGREALYVVATKTKIKALDGRPLLIDSGDSALNGEFSGLIPVHTGYRDAILYRVA